MDTRTIELIIGVFVMLVVLFATIRGMDLRGCAYWVAFMFWGGLFVWVLLMFLNGGVHL